MASEMLEKILIAENEARRCKENAILEAQKLINDAKKASAELVDTAKKNAEKMASDKILQAENEAEKLISERIKSSEAECEKLSKLTLEKSNECVSVVLDAILS